MQQDFGGSKEGRCLSLLRRDVGASVASKRNCKLSALPLGALPSSLNAACATWCHLVPCPPPLMLHALRAPHPPATVTNLVI